MSKSNQEPDAAVASASMIRATRNLGYLSDLHMISASEGVYSFLSPYGLVPSFRGIISPHAWLDRSRVTGHFARVIAESVPKR